MIVKTLRMDEMATRKYPQTFSGIEHCLSADLAVVQRCSCNALMSLPNACRNTDPATVAVPVVVTPAQSADGAFGAVKLTLVVVVIDSTYGAVVATKVHVTVATPPGDRLFRAT